MLRITRGERLHGITYLQDGTSLSKHLTSQVFSSRARAQPPSMPSVSEISLSSSHWLNSTRTPGPPATPVVLVLPGHLLSRWVSTSSLEIISAVMSMVYCQQRPTSMTLLGYRNREGWTYMSVVPSVMQVLGFEAQESTHPLELALVHEAVPLKGTEQLPGVEYEYTFRWDQLRQNGGEPIYWCLDSV